VSWAVTCFERTISGMSMPLSCWVSFAINSVGAEGAAVGSSEREAENVSLPY
jgi:hypothetical protein